MTNQQSIDKLQSLSLWLDKDSALYQAIVMAISALQAQDEEQREEPLYCDRDICLRNDYNGIGCEDCEVTKSQQQAKHGDGLDEAIRRLENISEYQSAEAERWDHSFDDYSGVKRDEYLKWSDEHRQLASWLKELKRLRAQEPCEDAVSRESILSILRENYRRLGLTDKAFMELCSLMKSEPSAQPKSEERKAESAQNVTKEDLISRKAAIDGKISIQRANGVEIYSDEAVPVEYLKRLPSAQPEKCTEKRTETHACDCISRQALLKQIDIDSDGEPGYYGDTWKFIDTIKNMPCAQPEPIRINLNEPIKVKLTDWGKKIYYHQYDRTNQIAGREICKPRFPREDENGYTEFQLWCFIELYGNHIGMTLPNVIEPLEIVYER